MTTDRIRSRLILTPSSCLGATQLRFPLAGLLHPVPATFLGDHHPLLAEGMGSSMDHTTRAMVIIAIISSRTTVRATTMVEARQGNTITVRLINTDGPQATSLEEVEGTLAEATAEAGTTIRRETKADTADIKSLG